MRSSRRWWIGVDGGGTKTTAALCDERGSVRALAAGEAANVLSRPLAKVEATIRRLVAALLEQVRGRMEEVEVVALALAGADRPEVKEPLSAALEKTGVPLVMDHDAVAALYAGTWGEPGIVLVAGTGSIAYGVSSRGQRCRVGGWGYLLGDEGSGYDIGRRALTAVLRESDGRGEATALTALVLDHYGVTRPDQLIYRLYGDAQPRQRIAEAAPLVLAAAERGDPVAAGIAWHAVAALAELAEACQARMGEPLPVVLAGGLLSNGWLSSRLAERLAGHTVIVPALPPAAGALAMALAQSGVTVDDAVRARITASWQALTRRG